MELKNIISLQKGSVVDKKDYDSLVANIPLNPIVTNDIIKNLKKVPEGEKPLDLIFAVKIEKSRNDRLYSIDVYKSIVDQILTSDVIIPVCYGHQDKEKVNWEGRKIVGSVIGAYLDEQAKIVYYRIIPDASKNNEDIRRWLKNRQINSVSIWGFLDSEKNAEGVEIVKGFSLLSVDFVPPLSEGQENVALIIGETYNQFNNRIITNPKKDEEANMPDEKLKIEDVANETLQGEMTKRIKDGRLSLKTIAGEMKCHVLTGEEFQGSQEEKEKLKNELNALLEKAKALGFNTFEELFTFASTTLKKAEEEKLQGEFKKLKEEVMTEKGLYENGKPKGRIGILIDRYAPIKQGMNRQEIKEVIDKMLTDKEIQALEVITETSGESINLRGEMLDSNSSKKTIIFEV